MISPATPFKSTEVTDLPGGASRGNTNPADRVKVFVAAGFFLALLALRCFYATNQPWDSDEPQHLHVVWAWANGLLPYKDVFDNHSPLFQALSAPIFASLGERADIVTAMRWVIMPVSLLVLWMTYLLGRRLFSMRVALWGSVL